MTTGLFPSLQLFLTNWFANGSYTLRREAYPKTTTLLDSVVGEQFLKLSVNAATSPIGHSRSERRMANLLKFLNFMRRAHKKKVRIYSGELDAHFIRSYRT